MWLLSGNCRYSLFCVCWEVLSWAVILVAKSKRGDCETVLAPLLGFLIGFVIADLCRVKAARENPGLGLYKIPSSPRWPFSLGPSVHSCSLLRRWPGFDPPPRASPRGRPPPLPSLLPTSSAPLLAEVIFFQRPSVWPSGEPLILSALQISRMGCQHLFQRLALAQRPLLLTSSEKAALGGMGGWGQGSRHRRYYFGFWHCNIRHIFQQRA